MNKYNFQVGDYCRHANGKIAIVAKVEKDSGFACKIGNSEYLWSYNNRFEPISLTEEILKANGFVMFIKDWAASHWYLRHDGNTIEILWEIGEQSLRQIAVGGFDVGLDYVHELQHILRLCGLTELANNFKLD